MANLTAEQVNEDVQYLMESLGASKRLIPSASTLLKKTSAIPLLAIALSFLSTIVFYLSSDWNERSIVGFFDFFINEGWVVVVPATIIGAFFILLTYGKLLMYLTVPENVRRNSIILSHLHLLTSRVVKFFIFMMVVSVILAVLSPIFTFAIPALLLIMMFAVGLIISAEINRIGTGVALEKITSLLQKI